MNRLNHLAYLGRALLGASFSLAGITSNLAMAEESSPRASHASAQVEESKQLHKRAADLDTQGHYTEAEPLYQEALTVAKKPLGPEHPHMGTRLDNLATFHWAQGRYAKPVESFTRAATVSEHNVSLNLTVGAETQKRAYLMTLSGELDAILSLHLDAMLQSRKAARLALRTLLQRKGRVLDALTEGMGANERELLDRLQAVRGEWSASVNRGLGPLTPENYRAQVAKLEIEADTLVGKLSARSAEFRAQSQPVTLEGVQAALPEGMVLVELAVYGPFNPKATKDSENYGNPQYAAYVLHPKGDSCAVRLGAAKDIEPKVEA